MSRRSQVVFILVGIFWQLSTVFCWAEPDPEIILSHDLIHFHLISGQTGPVDADTLVRIIIQSSGSGWVLNYQANPLIGSHGEISPDRIQVMTPYTSGFETLDLPRFVGRGEATGPESDEVATMQFRYMANGQEKAGTYEGNIFSSDGRGPTIHVRMIIEPPGAESKLFEPPAARQSAGSRIHMVLSPQGIRFPVTGTPGEYEADSPVHLAVESKYPFIVTTRATSLHSQYGDIPADRLFLTPGDGNSYSLEKDVVVLEGLSKIPEKGERISADLHFRLKTTGNDKAGEYTGEIVFTCMPGE
ncbi:MAG: hypothetical protein AB1847_04965 [bacterium]